MNGYDLVKGDIGDDRRLCLLAYTLYIEDPHHEEVEIALTGISYHRRLIERCSKVSSPEHEQWTMDFAYIVSLMWQPMEPSILDMCTHIDRSSRSAYNISSPAPL